MSPRCVPGHGLGREAVAGRSRADCYGRNRDDAIDSTCRLVLLVAGALGAPAWGAELKAIHTATAKDVVVTLLSESGQWMAGPNSFVVEFVSAKTKQPLDAGRVTLNTSMAMRGMAPMKKSATVTPDKTPGRYLAKISFPDVGPREVTVDWDGPAGKGSARFSVNVR